MKNEGKTRAIVFVVVFVCIFLCGGLSYYFYDGFNLQSTIKILGIQALLMLLLGIIVVATVMLILFIISKIKR
jgi:cytochrome c oxidase subunit IV